ncbi:ornithine cyclodeaminase family protein [Oceanicola sp. S124]|uniref:ornithine cyclodeaminase family protein n=1 Tax=Oceanicola sp. S124 TaxID=1042378 RepID=UPI0002557D71|nr:ornithine cyclodeaminase [Oceanicola sp. S124]
MSRSFVSYDDAISHVTWEGAIEALRSGHERPKAQLGDLFHGPATGTLLTRAAYIPGLGYGVKAVTVFDGNPKLGLDTVQGAMMVFEPEHGALSAVIDAPLITELKTAGDSVLGARLLARADSRHLLVVGGGTLARNLVKAYRAAFPALETVSVWTRRPEQAKALAEEMAALGHPVQTVSDLQAACGAADIISTATMAREPVIHGDWIRPGTHVDLIGAYKADMREADDALLARARLFVDSRDSTIGHIGELMIPMAAGVIGEDDVLGDLYDLVPGTCGRESADEITVFKNGGGAHLDTMIATYVAAALPKD